MTKKDFDGNKLPTVYDAAKPLTVGDLINILKRYRHDAIVYAEPINAHLKNSPSWASTFHGSYPCKQPITHKKAIMLIESSR